MEVHATSNSISIGELRYDVRQNYYDDYVVAFSVAF